VSGGEVPDRTYRRRIRAWVLYDWANSAFATTILAAVLPVYYSKVAGATLASPSAATARWSATLSVSLVIVSVLSPILGTVADILRGKKRFLAIFVGMGIVGTGLLVMVETGDWLLASALFIVGRVGFACANVFYDALLPHVAREEDRDAVSARGYAVGYLGGGLLLAVNVVMIQLLPGIWGPRLSFLSVAVWWGLFSIPILRVVPEPPSASLQGADRPPVLVASVARLLKTFRNLSRYRELFKFLIAFLIYNDGIGTIIGVAAIYGAELGFRSSELVAAILLVQFVGVPFSLAFGRIPDASSRWRGFYLAFVIYNLVAVPLAGVVGSRVVPEASLPFTLGLLAAVQAVGIALSLAARPLIGTIVRRFDTKRSIVLALVTYAVISVWGYFLATALEFWFLAWLVAVVQGGSQALSRSLYASLSPASESGEFFGFFTVMSKFSAILGPLLFAAAVWAFGSSRPAILSLIVFFIVGIALLARVDVEAGRRVAREVDSAAANL
jgi:UMF1 family MFS transporter